MKLQSDKKLADFHFKIIHRILPSCQENLHKWKISDSNLCRFGCTASETYNHVYNMSKFVTHSSKAGKTFQKIGINTKLTSRNLLFGYKAIQPPYTPFNKILSNIFYVIYKYWLHNNATHTHTQKRKQTLISNILTHCRSAEC